jgi:hypothetical protein
MKPDSIFSEEVILTLVNALDPATRQRLVEDGCKRLFSFDQPRSMHLGSLPVVSVDRPEGVRTPRRRVRARRDAQPGDARGPGQPPPHPRINARGRRGGAGQAQPRNAHFNGDHAGHRDACCNDAPVALPRHQEERTDHGRRHDVLRQLEVDMDTLRIVHVRSDGPDVVNNLRPFYTAAERPRMVFIQTGTDEDLEVYEEIPEGGRVVHEETPEVESRFPSTARDQSDDQFWRQATATSPPTPTRSTPRSRPGRRSATSTPCGSRPGRPAWAKSSGCVTSAASGNSRGR